MRHLSIENAEAILRNSNIKITDVGRIMWHRMVEAVCSAYEIGLDSELMKGVHKKDTP